jgi:hypothetical protein
VKAEARGRIAGIRDELEKELLFVIMRIRRRRFIGVITDSDLGWIVSVSKNKHVQRLLNEIATDIQQNAICTPDQLPDFLRDALNNYLADSHKGEKQVLSRINARDICLWIRRRVYPQEKAVLASQVKNRNDVEILLDAHDLSVTKNLPSLEFVTGDKNDIVLNSSHILSIVRLSAIRYLSTF